MTKIANSEIRINTKELVENITTSSNPTLKLTLGGELPANEDEWINSGKTLSDFSLKNVRSESQVIESIKTIINKFGLTQSEVMILIQDMTHMSLDDLMKLEQNEYTKLVKGLEKILDSCIVNGELDDEKLAEAKRDYSIATQTGWSLEGFCDWQKNHKKSSISERLKDVDIAVPDKNDPQYKEKMEKAIEDFFGKVLLCNVTDENREVEYKKQLQSFGRILVNTEDPEEATLLATAIDKLYRTNTVSAVKATMTLAETPEIKREVALAVNKDLKDILTTAVAEDPNVFMTQDDSVELTQLVYAEFNSSDIETNLPIMRREAEEFVTKNKEILREIESKEEKDLTLEELTIKREYENLHVGRYSGATAGIASNKDEEVVEKREEYLTTLVQGAKDITEKTGNDFYNNVITEVVEFVEKPNVTLALPTTDFYQLMDKIAETVGVTKFSEIANNVLAENKNLNPDQTNSVNTSEIQPVKSQGDLGYNSRELAGVNPESRVAELYMTNSIEQAPVVSTTSVDNDNSTRDKSSKNILNVAKGHIAEFYSYISDNGVYKTVAEVYKNFSDIRNQVVLGTAKKLYSMLTPDFQEKILRNVTSSDAYTELLGLTNDDVVLTMTPNFSNSFKNQALENAQKRIREKSNKD